MTAILRVFNAGEHIASIVFIICFYTDSDCCIRHTKSLYNLESNVFKTNANLIYNYNHIYINASVI